MQCDADMGTMESSHAGHGGHDHSRMIADFRRRLTERRTLTQDDLQKVPPDADGYTFVNLHVPSGDFVSCVITQPDTQVYGSMRAFW